MRGFGTLSKQSKFVSCHHPALFSSCEWGEFFWHFFWTRDSGQKKMCKVPYLLRRVAVRSFASVARPTAVPTRPTIPWTVIAMTAMVSPSRQQQVSPLSPRSPTRSLGAIRAWPSCRPCLRVMQKARRKPVSLRSARNMTMTPVTVPTVNRKLGMATWDLVLTSILN